MFESVKLGFHLSLRSKETSLLFLTGRLNAERPACGFAIENRIPCDALAASATLRVTPRPAPETSDFVPPRTVTRRLFFLCSIKAGNRAVAAHAGQKRKDKQIRLRRSRLLSGMSNSQGGQAGISPPDFGQHTKSTGKSNYMESELLTQDYFLLECLPAPGRKCWHWRRLHR